MNDDNPMDFVSTTMTLGFGGWILGHSIERTVGSRGIVTRLAVNALVLYSLYMLLPWSITSHLQDTLPGLVFCATYFNIQRWDTRKLF